MKRLAGAVLMSALIAAVVHAGSVQAQTPPPKVLSHYTSLAGMPALDDFFMPAPEVGSLVYGQYNSYYTTDTFRNPKGEKVKTITVEGPLGNPREIKLDVDVDMWVLAPLLMWAPDWEVLGGRYGAFVMVPVGNPSLGASLQKEIGFGRHVDESPWDIADLFVQPVWFNWKVQRFDLSTAYGFYAPTGKYEKGAADNTGFGFWSHEFIGAVRYHFDEAETLSGVFALVGEINHEQEDSDLTPGSHITLNWGARKDCLDGWLRFSIIGYNTWQASDDHGSDAGPPSMRVRDQVHAAGFNVGVPKLGLSLNYTHEFQAKDRFEGQTLMVFFALPLDPVVEWMGVG
jgi:hypothetical protein